MNTHGCTCIEGSSTWATWVSGAHGKMPAMRCEGALLPNGVSLTQLCAPVLDKPLLMGCNQLL